MFSFTCDLVWYFYLCPGTEIHFQKYHEILYPWHLLFCDQV
uniref:Uncharacterized protein n=1 Tax=Rhizophora mucronata TaxID=61149 RepID=A0A2P2QNM9_RHIMU